MSGKMCDELREMANRLNAIADEYEGEDSDEEETENSAPSDENYDDESDSVPMKKKSKLDTAMAMYQRD